MAKYKKYIPTGDGIPNGIEALQSTPDGRKFMKKEIKRIQKEEKIKKIKKPVII